MLGVLLVGLSSIIATMGCVVRLGAHRGRDLSGLARLEAAARECAASAQVGRTPKPRGGFFLQGFLVLMSNPKALLWFGAFIPQFVDPAGNYVGQIVLLGATAMATAALTDGAYAVLGGRTGRFMSAKRIRLASQLSGLFLIGGGVWLAFTRAR